MEDDDNDYTRADELLDLYILVDRLGDLTAANHTIGELIKYCDENNMMPDAATSDRIFHAVAQGSQVRNLLVDFHVRDAGESITGDGLSRDMLVAIFRKFSRARRAAGAVRCFDPEQGYIECVTELIEEDKCRYHHHDKDHPKCAEDEVTSGSDSD